MPNGTKKRKNLDFQTFDDLKKDLLHLSQTPYTRAGNWSLGEVCDHIKIFLDNSMDGFNLTLPFHLRMIGPIAKLITMKSRWIPSGVKAPDVLLPLNPTNDPQAVERLQTAIERYLAHTSPLYPSPLFGKLKREEWDQLHLIHAAHHLRFLVPQG